MLIITQSMSAYLNIRYGMSHLSVRSLLQIALNQEY